MGIVSDIATGGMDGAIGGVSKLFDDALNKIWPDPQAKASAEAMLFKTQADAELDKLKQQMSVMLAEASSTDPWTSRARPSFLYVMYLMILISIPYAILWAFYPVAAERMAHGLQFWLGAIPDGLWSTFAIGYTGYTVARSADKAGGIMPFFRGAAGAAPK